MVHGDDKEASVSYQEQLEAKAKRKEEQLAAFNAKFEEAKKKKEEEAIWRAEHRAEREAAISTARGADQAVALATKEVDTLFKDRVDVRRNMARLKENHTKAAEAHHLAKVKAQMAQREADQVWNKEKACRATLKEAQDLLENDGLKQAALNLEDALTTCKKAWDEVPNHIRKDAKKGRDRKIKKAATEMLKKV